MFSGKPVIGIIGGIGSGKSFVADLFGELGCLVIKSDDQVRQAYREPQVKEAIRQWWGDAMLTPDGEVNRAAIAGKVFSNPAERQRLEQLLHPMVAEARDRLMAQAAKDPAVRAYVWDTPLLLEAGLKPCCDAVVFVEAPLEVRQERVKRTRGWEPAELIVREKSQLPLDKKQEMSDYMIRNTAEAEEVHRQVREVLSRILATTGSRSTPE